MSTIVEGMSVYELNAKIAELESALQSGETSTSIDGTTATVDLGVIQRQLLVLYRRRDQVLQRPERKPRIATIDTGSCW